MRRVLMILLTLFMLLTLLPVSTGVLAIGSGEDWTVVFFNPTEADAPGELLVVTQDGVQDSIPLPERLFERVEDEIVPGQIDVSPDLRFLIATYSSLSQEPQGIPPLEIHDLQTDAVYEIAAPLAFPVVYSAVISPDSKTMAVAYVGVENEADLTDGTEVIAGLMQVELVSGAILTQIDMDDVNAAVNPNGEWALLTSWTGVTPAGVIPFVPGCFLCNQVEPEHIWHWNPADNTFTETDQFYVPFGSLLPESGEVLVARINLDFPVGDDDPNAYLPPSNVIEYFPAGADPREPGIVVYFDDDRYPLGGAPWVQDGRAFLTRKQGDPEGVLVFRDGSVQTFELPVGPVVVVGTHHGALVVDVDGIIYDYRVVNGEVTSTELVELNFSDSYTLENVSIIYSTPIGESAGGKPFPDVPEPRNTAMR